MGCTAAGGADIPCNIIQMCERSPLYVCVQLIQVYIPGVGPPLHAYVRIWYIRTYSRRCVSATEHYPKRFPTNFLLEYMTKLQVVVMSWCLKLG